MTHATTEIAVEAIECRLTISGPSSAESTPTSGTFTEDFQAEKHRLSGKATPPARRATFGGNSDDRRN